jgi:hypothetical protein
MQNRADPLGGLLVAVERLLLLLVRSSCQEDVGWVGRQ